MKIYSLIFFLLVSTRGQASDETIIVRGQLNETNSDRKTGQSLLASPDDASRFDSLTFLKRESSVMAPETGRISPSGFTVPKIRGQDVKLTDVYLEDILLQEPYSGLPLIEDLDLRAFGSLEVHQGLSPPDVPGLNPIGILRYRFRRSPASNYKLGLQHGRPFGWASWGMAETVAEGRNARVYARHHQSNGKFKFYSDEGTPYNSQDDALRMRENNDQRSMQAVPYFRQEIGLYQIEGIGWLYHAERGLPSMSSVASAMTREEAKGHLANVKVGRTYENFAWFKSAQTDFSLTDSKDRRLLADPDQSFLGAAAKGDLKVDSQRGGLHAKLETDATEIFLSYETGMARVRHKLDGLKIAKLDRQISTASLGGRFELHPLWIWEFKGASRHHLDKQHQADIAVAVGGETLAERRKRNSEALGTSLAFAEEDWGVYLQVALSNRLPSLIEEYGNGSMVRGNTKIKAEGIRHQEWGFFAKNRDHWRLGAAVYQDKVEDKIVFVPVMANAVKAQNLRKTSILGIDAKAETGFKETRLYLSMSRLLPYDESMGQRQLLPGIPQRIVVGELEQKYPGLTGRWLARYRSDFYRDLANSVHLPGALTHDAHLDFEFEAAQVSWQIGFAVRNVFNLMVVDIEAPHSPENRGKTSFSDIAGAPLPGRNWLLSSVVNF